MLTTKDGRLPAVFRHIPALAAALALLGAQADRAAASGFRADVQTARVGELRIAWYERGAGPPLVMAIGTGSTMAEWDPALLELLAARHRLILFDYAGVGRSSALPPGPTSFAALADQAAGFMRAIGVPQADVLGWSMGGFVAQQLAIRHPGQVRRLILAGTNPGGDAALLGPPSAQAIDSEPNASDADALKVLYPRTAAGQAEGRAFLRRLDRASTTGEIPDDFHVRAAAVRKQVAAEDPWLRSNANADALRTITAPTLVAGGTRDDVVPPVNLRRIARRIPGAQLDLYPGAGHAFLFQDRRRFARSVLAFLAASRSAQNARVADRVAARLRPDGEAVGA